MIDLQEVWSGEEGLLAGLVELVRAKPKPKQEKLRRRAMAALGTAGNSSWGIWLGRDQFVHLHISKKHLEEHLHDAP